MRKQGCNYNRILGQRLLDAHQPPSWHPAAWLLVDTNGAECCALFEGFGDNTLFLGQTITSGIWAMSADLHKDAGAGGELQVDLRNPGSNFASFDWLPNGKLHMQGLHDDFGNITTGMVDGNLHVEYILDLDNETGSVSWFDIDDPGDATTSGFVDLGPFAGIFSGDAPPFAYSQILIFGGNRSEVLPIGFDNLSLVQIPEPASLTLFGLGGLLLAIWGWRRRKDC